MCINVNMFFKKNKTKNKTWNLRVKDARWGLIEDSPDYNARSVYIINLHSISKKRINCRKQRCEESKDADLTCAAGCSAPRRCGLLLQLCATDAEMLTPVFGELQGRTAWQGLYEAQHNATKRISSQTPFTFPLTHEAVSIRQHSNCCWARRCSFEANPESPLPVELM